MTGRRLVRDELVSCDSGRAEVFLDNYSQYFYPEEKNGLRQKSRIHLEWKILINPSFVLLFNFPVLKDNKA